MKHTRTFQKVMAVLLTVLLALSATALVSFAADDYDLTGATRFVFSDSGIAVTAGDYTGYKVSGTALTINAAGTYGVSGACANGLIKVKKGTTGVVLVLSGLTLTSSSETITENTAPLLCNKSTGVTIVVAAGTTNTLTDSKYNNDELYPANTDDDAHGGSAENAVIKTKAGSNVTICGTGTLIVNAYGKTGIKGSADQGEGTASDEQQQAEAVLAVPGDQVGDLLDEPGDHQLRARGQQGGQHGHHQVEFVLSVQLFHKGTPQRLQFFFRHALLSPDFDRYPSAPLQ